MANSLMRFFGYKGLPANLEPVSAQFCAMARILDDMLPESAEKTAGLRKLLEARDCFARAASEIHTQPPIEDPAKVKDN